MIHIYLMTYVYKYQQPKLWLSSWEHDFYKNTTKIWRFWSRCGEKVLQLYTKASFLPLQEWVHYHDYQQYQSLWSSFAVFTIQIPQEKHTQYNCLTQGRGMWYSSWSTSVSNFWTLEVLPSLQRILPVDKGSASSGGTSSPSTISPQMILLVFKRRWLWTSPILAVL